MQFDGVHSPGDLVVEVLIVKDDIVVVAGIDEADAAQEMSVTVELEVETCKRELRTRSWLGNGRELRIT